MDNIKKIYVDIKNNKSPCSNQCNTDSMNTACMEDLGQSSSSRSLRHEGAHVLKGHVCTVVLRGISIDNGSIACTRSDYM